MRASAPSRASYLLSGFFLSLCVATSVARADEASLSSLVQSFADQQNPGGSRMEVTVGSLNPRLKLAPCARMEPFVPNGMRMWGRTYLGVRCVEGAKWNVMIPITVKIYGNALVAAAPLTAGGPLSENDVREEEVEYTRYYAPPLTDRTQLDGKILVRSLMPGQTLRREDFRVPPTVVSGDAVRIEMRGEGFAISSTGQALNAAGEGQTVRVKTDAGKLLSGTVREGKTVEVRL